jgi:hypothetical protein
VTCANARPVLPTNIIRISVNFTNSLPIDLSP